MPYKCLEVWPLAFAVTLLFYGNPLRPRHALQVSGIEGNYRITCNNTLRVLRVNRDSLMAVLEAFVYDPLINWRLMESVWTLWRHRRGPVRMKWALIHSWT